MFKIISLFFFFTVIFFLVKEIYRINKKSGVEDELRAVKTDEDLFDMERETIQRQEKLNRKREALYRTEEEEETKA